MKKLGNCAVKRESDVGYDQKGVGSSDVGLREEVSSGQCGLFEFGVQPLTGDDSSHRQLQNHQKQDRGRDQTAEHSDIELLR